MLPNTRRLLFACFLTTGATSLILEVAWSKQLSYLLGNTLFAVSTVVAAFMAGLCVGSALLSRRTRPIASPLRVYGLLQLAIGVYGVISIPLFRATEPLLRALHQSTQGTGFLIARFLVVLVVMLGPVMLMGMTLPLLTSCFAGDRERYARVAGVLYGLNTLGAVLGTLCAGFVLLPALGLLRSTWLAGSLDIAVGLVAIVIARGLTRSVPTQQERRDVAPSTWNAAQWRLAILFGLSGAVALLCEVAWFRLLGLTLGPSVDAFTTMLAVYLAGIGIGSAVAAPWIERSRREGLFWLATLEGAFALLTLGGLYFANALPHLQLSWSSTWMRDLGDGGFALAQLAVAALLLFAPCLCLGALFPAAVRALGEVGPGGRADRSIARLYLCNTAGSIAGTLLGGFVLLPEFGTWASLRTAGIASAAIGVTFHLLRTTSPRARLMGAISTIVAAALLGIFAPAWDVVAYNRGLYRGAFGSSGAGSEHADPGELLYFREGLTTPVAVFRTFGGASLYVSGKPDASTGLTDAQTQLLLGHLPVLFCPEPRKVAVIGYGSGMTVGAVLAHPEVRSVDVLEIERAVLDASPYFECINGNPFDDPRSHVIVEDGRTWLGYTKERYDVISSEPSNPWIAGVANLFTVDFYRTVRARLAPRGVFAQWIQNYSISPEVFESMLGALHEVFPHLLVFQPNLGDFLILASADPIAVPWPEFARRCAEPTVAASLRRVEIDDPLELAFFLSAPEELAAAIAARARIRNTDDNAWLEHRMPREMIRAARSPETQVDVGFELAGAGAFRLRAWEHIWPGFPRAEGLRAAIRFPSDLEPVSTSEGWHFDPWNELRKRREAGLEEEVTALGDPALVAAVSDARLEAAEHIARRTEAGRLLTNGRPTGAAVDRALDLAPDFSLAWNFRGLAMNAAGRPDDAAFAFRRALERPASDAAVDAMLGLARLARDRGALDEAIAGCQAAADRNPYLPAAFALWARLESARGNFGAARHALDRGLFFNPNDVGLRKQREELR